jgi:Uncharacterised protein family (UPF0240).
VNPERPLPQDRKQLEVYEFGVKEPRMITQGRFTLKQAIKFISDHQTDPVTWSAAAIAKEFKIDQQKLGTLALDEPVMSRRDEHTFL